MSSGKVKCTCGWSWNKSDSSKKDMYICHECGRDNSNNMQNGGWLDNYADGGTMQEHQENYNDSKVSAPKGMVGDGYSNVGRNYSPAWGGQFQMGGKLKSSIPVIEDAGNYNEEGRWVPDWKTMTAQAKKLGAKKVKTKHGSLIVFNDNWEVVGVDDNPDAMQTGGSIPGAVGFSYARTNDPAPSNGPYAKKTKASAQNGNSVDMYNNPITAIETLNPNIDRTFYDHRTNRMMLGNDYTGWIADENLQDKVKTHENYHAKQFDSGRYNYDIAHNTDQRQWAEMQKKPQMMSTSDVWGNYYNRKEKETQEDLQNIRENYPELRFAPDELLVDKIIDREQYSNPYSMEGEAMYYENTGKDFYKLQNGGSKELPSVRSLINDTMNRKIQGKGKDVKTVKKDNTKTSTLKEIKKLSGKQQNELAQRLSEEQAAKDWVQNSMQEAYQSPLMSPGYFTPEGMAIGAMQGATKLGPDLYEGDYKGAAMDALMVLPEAGNIAKALGPSEGLLSNAYKYNPWAFKPNSEAYYRGIGKEGMDDILNSGIIRSKKQNAYPEPYFSKGKIGDAYAKGYFAELTNEPMKGVGSFSTGDLIQTPVSKVSINNPNLKLYQKDWLRGYKPVEVPNNPTPIRNLFIQPESKFSQGELSPEMEPYLSRVGESFSEYIPYREDDYIKWFNEQKAKMNPSTPIQDKRSILRGSSIIDINDMKEGGVIKDDLGQWAHPGEITEINSNDITMEGVPYDVLGISDTGDTKLMKPGKKYKFKGKKVTEFPMAKNGLRQEQKGLVNLDNLTNFTNYNTKQPGGWLDQY